MKIDLTIIKNESVSKFEKSICKVGDKFQDMLSIALDAMIHEIDAEKRGEVIIALDDMLRDEFSQYKISFIRCMNKAAELVENGLGS